MTFTFKALNCRAMHRAPCVNLKPIFKIQRIIIFLVILTFFNFFGLATLLSHSAHALFRNKIISTEKWLENWKPNCIWELGGDFWRFDESTLDLKTHQWVTFLVSQKPIQPIQSWSKLQRHAKDLLCHPSSSCKYHRFFSLASCPFFLLLLVMLPSM